MKLRFKNIILLVASLLITSCSSTNAPEPFGATPSERQIEWHKMKYYAFIHFGPNTFTDREWGFGDESPEIFNPTGLDCRQWAMVVRNSGMEGIVITAKHHDGFCLWPSEYTRHSVKYSPWKDGKGDIIRELREACDEYGLKLGIYLSPWDRNHELYGEPGYITYYRNQLTELMTNYGQIFEVWFDGANGGSGFYGGARETRRIDNRSYYDWENTSSIVRELQPMAVMFSDGGPDIRWIGNEQGYSDSTNWCTMNSDTLYPGIGGVGTLLQHGIEDGNIWLPAEVNTSIRPGWFYHSAEDNLVKTTEELVEIWFSSVGMNGSFILNLPVDKRGLVHENDIKSLMNLRGYLDSAFTVNYALEAKVNTSLKRGNRDKYSGKNVNDDDPDTYWTTDDGITRASIELDFQDRIAVNCIMMQEYLQLGQRVNSFTIETFNDSIWTKVGQGTTIGNRRLIRFNTVTSKSVRINFSSKAGPAISNIEVYHIPDIQTGHIK